MQGELAASVYDVLIRWAPLVPRLHSYPIAADHEIAAVAFVAARAIQSQARESQLGCFRR